ncbi:Ulp1-like peptidase [Cucumis melo var. makuwa]|uniref:Ulp1-like peptidase n=1 Tax=Cucumis melo var. makuwa TaxID=1194695 RepID=A0A5D3BYQ8_CUCMM|nr:Ulp1-like peptidase [Cucumis melo var. makuwa]
MMSNDQPCVEEQHTQDHNVETQRQHQEESGSVISIDGRDANLLLTIRDISDNLNAQSRKEKDLPEMITTLPLVSQPLPLFVGDFQEKSGWENVNYVIGCINIREHWLAITADMRKGKIYVFDSMSDYVEKTLFDQALQMPARCIASLVIAIKVDLHSKKFKYGPWPVLRSTKTLQRWR